LSALERALHLFGAACVSPAAGGMLGDCVKRRSLAPRPVCHWFPRRRRDRSRTST
jgi:hypothetical protein